MDILNSDLMMIGIPDYSSQIDIPDNFDSYTAPKNGLFIGTYWSTSEGSSYGVSFYVNNIFVHRARSYKANTGQPIQILLGKGDILMATYENKSYGNVIENNFIPYKYSG